MDPDLRDINIWQDHEKRLLKVEGQYEIVTNQLSSQTADLARISTHIDTVTRRIDNAYNQNQRLYWAIISVGGAMIVGLVVVIIKLLAG